MQVENLPISFDESLAERHAYALSARTEFPSSSRNISHAQDSQAPQQVATPRPVLSPSRSLTPCTAAWRISWSVIALHRHTYIRVRSKAIAMRIILIYITVPVKWL